MKVESEFDFGFEIVAESDVNKDVIHSSQDEALKYLNEATQLREMILPLLHNLGKNPDREYIKWPNRTKTINDFIRKIFAVSGLNPSEGDLV